MFMANVKRTYPLPLTTDDGAGREPACWQHIGILIAICLGLWALTCGQWDLWGPDEARYVQIAKELLPRHNWFLLTLHGQAYDEKPPLPFWMLAGMLKLNGGQVNNALVRLPSVFFALLSVVLCYLIGRRLWGARAGLLSAFVLLSSVQFLEDTPTTELNVIYTGWTVMSLAFWFLAPQAGKLSWLRTVGFWASMAGAFFTKGPLAIVIVLSALAGEAIVSRSLRPFSRVRPVAGLLFLSALIGGWLLLQSQTAGSEFVLSQVKGQTLERFLYGKHEAPIWYYLHRLFTGVFLPWGVLLFPAAMRLKRLGRQLPPGMGALLGWVFIPFLVLTLAHGKRQTYLLPLLPAMALIVGWYLDRLQLEGRAYPRLGNGLAMIFVAFGVLLICAAMALGIAPSLLTSNGLAISPIGNVILVLLGSTAIGLSLWLRRQAGSPALIGVGVTGFMLTAGLLLFGVINPALNPGRTTRPFSLMLDKMVRGQKSAAVAAIGRAKKPEYYVYGDFQVRDYEAKDLAQKHADLPTVLVGRDRDWEDVHEHPALSNYRLTWSGEVSGDHLMVYVKQ